jgi:hypothetical protein
MPAIVEDCPHCTGEKVGFSYVAESSFAPADKNLFMALFKCNKCQRGLIIEYRFQVNYGPASPGACPTDPTDLGFVIVKKYPGKTPTKIPTHCPEPLGRFFKQAFDACRRGDHDASGAMSRKVVDVSTQQLLGEKAKEYRNIHDRINALSITPDLKAWAHEVRIGGNEATHDPETYSEKEAEELLDFVELYLTYIYTLPGRLKERRERAKEPKDAAT